MDSLAALLPSLGTIVAVVLALVLAHRLLERPHAAGSSRRFRNQVVMLTLTGIGAIAVIMALPIGDAKRGQLLGLIGIVVSAAVALSSTTLLGNALAGVMLRSLRNFRTGDFIRCGEHFGRVSERGLLHTEIQTEDRDLTTIPNLYLITHPVTTVRTSGTIVSATVSLGYDVPRTQVESCLLAAASGVDLTDPFVQVIELGDFSVSYRIAGLLTEVKSLVTARSRLRAAMMDHLHERGVEIVSPRFMNQRVLDPAAAIIPDRGATAVATPESPPPEALLFDKAEEAESLEKLRDDLAAITDELAVVSEQIGESPDDAGRTEAERRRDRLTARKEALERMITAREEAVDR